MKTIPQEIMTAVDACFAAGIAFDLAVMINNAPYRIVSIDAGVAAVRNDRQQCIVVLYKD